MSHLIFPISFSISVSYTLLAFTCLTYVDYLYIHKILLFLSLIFRLHFVWIRGNGKKEGREGLGFRFLWIKVGIWKVWERKYPFSLGNEYHPSMVGRLEGKFSSIFPYVFLFSSSSAHVYIIIQTVLFTSFLKVLSSSSVSSSACFMFL